MAHMTDAHVAPDVHELLFKADRPRPIDRYIDYFGTADTARGQDGQETDEPSFCEALEGPR